MVQKCPLSNPDADNMNNANDFGRGGLRYNVLGFHPRLFQKHSELPQPDGRQSCPCSVLYILPPSFMLKVSFIPPDSCLLTWQSGCQTHQWSQFGIDWDRAFLAEIAWGLVTIMSIRNGTKLCGCDYENIDGGRGQERTSSQELDKANSKMDIANH